MSLRVVKELVQAVSSKAEAPRAWVHSLHVPLSLLALWPPPGLAELFKDPNRVPKVSYSVCIEPGSVSYGILSTFPIIKKEASRAWQPRTLMSQLTCGLAQYKAVTRMPHPLQGHFPGTSPSFDTLKRAHVTDSLPPPKTNTATRTHTKRFAFEKL